MKKAKPLSESKVEKAVTDFIFSFPFFETLSSEELLYIAEHINFLEVEPGEVLFRQGEQGDCVYFVVEGQLNVIKETQRGKGKAKGKAPAGASKVSLLVLFFCSSLALALALSQQ